jgi:hypothetical protein
VASYISSLFVITVLLKHFFACQANVYRGLDPKDSKPLAIAIKKSHTSQHIRQPTLQHEARLLSTLMGHPTIPLVFAYGHLPHFEYLAMELLGNSLDWVTPTDGMNKEVMARIAVQMVCFSLALNLSFS